MPKSTPSPAQIAGRIERLLADRQHHADALAEIDSAVEQIRSALQGINGTGVSTRPRSGTVAAEAMLALRKRRGRRGKYGKSSTEMILELVGHRGGATTQEIKAKWKAEGRGGTSDNALSKLVMDGKLKRTPLVGQRGSRFTLP